MFMIKRLFLGTMLLVVPVLLHAQEIADRKFDDFDEIRIFGNFSVVMEPGTENNVHIESKDVSLDEIETELEGKELKIKMTSKLFKDPDVFIRVTYQSLESITTLADAEVEFKKPIVQDVFNIKATSGSHIMLEANCKNIEVKAYQGGQVQIKGKTEQFDGYINTGGILSGTDLVCKKVNVKLNTGGKGELTVKEELEARVNTGSDFSYYGTPESKKVSTSLGGNISAWDEE
jgi:hypothetical protein